MWSERADQLAVCTHDLGQRVTGDKPPEAEVLEQQAGPLDDVLRVLRGDKRLDLLLGAIKARRAKAVRVPAVRPQGSGAVGQSLVSGTRGLASTLPTAKSRKSRSWHTGRSASWRALVHCITGRGAYPGVGKKRTRRPVASPGMADGDRGVHLGLRSQRDLTCGSADPRDLCRDHSGRGCRRNGTS